MLIEKQSDGTEVTIKNRAGTFQTGSLFIVLTTHDKPGNTTTFFFQKKVLHSLTLPRWLYDICLCHSLYVTAVSSLSFWNSFFLFSATQEEAHYRHGIPSSDEHQLKHVNFYLYSFR